QDFIHALEVRGNKIWKELQIDTSRINPNSPHAVAFDLFCKPPPDAAKLAEIEKRYIRFPLVQEYLGRVHGDAGRVEDAARCWQRRLDLSLDVRGLYDMARMYSKNKRLDLWAATLEKTFEVEESKFELTNTKYVLAQYLIDIGDFKKAEPYAEAGIDLGH